MADAFRHTSSDVPDFDTYPATPGSAERLLPETASEANFGSTLEDRAYGLGEVAGRAIVRIRDLRRLLQRRVRDLNEDASQKLSDVTDSARSKLSDVADTAQSRLEELKDKASIRAEDWKLTARERFGEARRQVRRNVYRARIRVRELEREHPVEMALGAGAAGVLVGAALRIWRASRA